MKLKNRIVLFTVIICLISIVSMSVLNYALSIKTLEEEVNEKIVNETISVSNELDSWLKNQKISMDELIGGMIVSDNFETEYAANYLKAANDRTEGANYYMAFSDGEFIHHSAILGSDPTDRPWYIEAVESEDFYISDPYVDQVLDDMIITISKSFSRKDGVEGVVAVDIRINYLTEYVSNIELGEDSYAFLMDGNGNIMTHENEKNNPTEDNLVNIKDLSDGKLVEVINLDNMKIQDRKFEDYDGIERLLFFSNLKETSWNVGTAVSVNDSLGIIDSVTKTTIIAAIIILMVGIGLAYYIGNYISKPIIRATAIAEHIGNLDLTDTIESDILNRKDEIGVMALAFKSIIEKLRSFMLE